MSREVLDFIGLDLEKIPKKIVCTKPKYNIAKSFDNEILYKIYKKISVKDMEILISDSDRTTDIKERYKEALPIQEYIKENKESFEALAENTSVKAIEELDEMQKKFKSEIPYFIKYDKNYIWQIYYSREDDKYFMLFPSKAGEAESLFYVIQKKLAKTDTQIYVPICKEDYEDGILSIKNINDIENYIWVFTKEWPNIYQVTTDKTDIYITGKTKVQDGLISKYRIKLENEEDANKLYNLLKALFIIETETNYAYSFEPRINDSGELAFAYNDEIITFENLQKFVSDETIKQQNKKYEIKRKIDSDNEKLKSLKDLIKEQNDIYTKQEKQIVMFMNCRRSFFKKVKFFFKSSKKFSKDSEEIISKLKKQENTIIEKEKINDNEKIKSAKSEELSDGKIIFTVADLVKTCEECKGIDLEEKNLCADIKALELKEKNMSKKIENAKLYLEEIEKHKKSIFEFWKFTNKDNQQVLAEGQTEIVENKIQPSFDIEEDLTELSIKMDEMQRRKLSIDETNAIFIAKHLLPAINSVVTKSDTYIIEEQYEKMKTQYKLASKFEDIFGGIQDDYTKIKTLNNKQHRENYKDLFAILKFNENTTLEDFKERIKENAALLNEAFQKITSEYEMKIYYSNRAKGFIIGEINPYKLFENNDENNKIYKMQATRETHLLFLTNIIFYNNTNKTLPLGMDKSTEVIMKVGENKKVSETTINLVIEKDLFNVEVKKIRMIEEEKR